MPNLLRVTGVQGRAASADAGAILDKQFDVSTHTSSVWQNHPARPLFAIVAVLSFFVCVRVRVIARARATVFYYIHNVPVSH